jgi:hypothetical protein
MSESTSNTSGGIGIFGLTFVALLVLKLTGHITWSWWWVTAPLWGSFSLLLGCLLVVAIVSCYAEGLR